MTKTIKKQKKHQIKYPGCHGIIALTFKDFKDAKVVSFIEPESSFIYGMI